MPHTIETPVNALTSVDYFKAKLQFELGPKELHELMQEKHSIVVLDARDAPSFEKEHIPGAMNVPLADLPKSLARIPRDKTIVTYCWSMTCHLATKAALELAHRGFKVAELIGGIAEWKNGGFPVEGQAVKKAARA